MGKDFIVALDLGTTGNRAIAYSEDGSILGSEYQEFPNYYPKPDWVEQDAYELWQSAKTVLTSLFSSLPVTNCKGMGLSNQRETIIAWNPKTGRCYHRAIVWQCRRSQSICDELKPHEPMIKEKTGLLLDPYFSATKIRWLVDHVNEVRSAVSSGDIYFGTVDSWIIWNLSAGQSFVTDHSNASRTLLYNLHKQDYDEALLDLFGVPSNSLPQILDSDSLFAYSDPSLFSASIPISAVLGDQQSALFAQSATDKMAVKATFGTGLFLMNSTGDSFVVNDNSIQTVAKRIRGKISYANEGAAFTAGAAMTWCRDQLGLFNDYSETETMARSIDSNEGVYFMPSLSGFAAPYWQANATAEFLGLTQATRKVHLIRAVLESIAYQTRLLLSAISEQESSISVLKVDGGLSQNNFLMQFLSDLCACHVQRPRSHEATALGIAALASQSLGFCDSSIILSTQSESDDFFPTENNQALIASYDHWKALLQRSFSSE